MSIVLMLFINSKGPSVEQIDILYDPVYQEDQHYNTVNRTNQIVDSIERLDIRNSYSTIMSSLWNTGLPCTDSGTSEGKETNKSILKYCAWKGKQVPCADIFSTYPTDQGMCCTFNMRIADDLFTGQTYPQLIKTLQNKEKPSGLHLPIEIQNTEPGKNKGLFVVLDLHSDILSTSSIDDDKQGFIGLITQGGNFPQVNVGGFDIKPGHKNVVGLTGTMISADIALRSMDPNSRNCSFPWENNFLNIFKNYTQSNCYFECNFEYAKKKLEQQCSPWYFPSPDILPTICGPWQAAQLVEEMSNVPIIQCNHCLPDCDSTTFKARISAAPLRKCQLNSFRSNTFCNQNDDIVFSSEFISNMPGYDFRKRFSTQPYFYTKSFASSQRKIGSALSKGDVFDITNVPYNAFDNDIASVQIFFDSAYATQILRSPKMSWIDYFSNVGGIFGLVLGMGIISLLEVVLLLFRYLTVFSSLF